MARKTLVGGTIIRGTRTTRIRTGEQVVVMIQAAGDQTDDPKKEK